MARLGDICTVVSGSTPKTNIPEYWDGDIKWITPAELNEDSFYIFDSQRHITELGKEKTGLSYMPAGTVILSSRAPIGKTAIAGCELCCNQGFKNLICSDAIFNEYLYFFLKSKTDYLNSLGRGATFKEISKNIVENIEIRLPSLEEQKQVAKQLGHIYHLISLRKQQLAKLDELVKARFVELFDSKGYGEVTVHSVLNTSFWLMPATPEFIIDGEVPYITSKNIKNRMINFDNVKYISKEAYKSISANRPVQKGDILVSMIGTLGQTAVIQEERDFYGQNIYLLRLNNTVVDTTYFCEFFNSDTAQHELQGKRNQSTQAYLKANHVEDLTMPLPPLSLQKQFAEFVKQTDKSKLTIQQSLDKLEVLKQALMQTYFL